MTLDEAIKHCLEVAEQNETQADKIGRQFIGSAMDKRATDCRECAADHRQLAEWLTELDILRHRVLGDDPLIDETISMLDSKLKEAKRLLKSATKVLNSYMPCDEDYNCTECIKQGQNCDYDDRFKWRYADEALALIGEDGDTNG